MFNIFIPLGKLSSFSVNLGQKLVFVSHLLTKRSFFLGGRLPWPELGGSIQDSLFQHHYFYRLLVLKWML